MTIEWYGSMTGRFSSRGPTPLNDTMLASYILGAHGNVGLKELSKKHFPDGIPIVCEIDYATIERRLLDLGMEKCMDCNNLLFSKAVRCPQCISKEIARVEIGMGATIYVGSDRYPAHVVSKSASGKTVVIQRASYRRIDKNGFSESQKYEITKDPEGTTESVRMSRYGEWKGLRSGWPVSFGIASAHWDPHF